MSEPSLMIEHMFDSMVGSEAGSDENVAPVSPAMPEVSAAAEGGGAAPSAPCWRETMPGPEMIAALADVSLQSCTDEQLLDVLAGWERVSAWVSAQQTRVLARTETRLVETAARDDRDLDGKPSWTAVYRQVETEISTALHWTSWHTTSRLDLARTLTGRRPAVLDAMSAGQISYRHADVICDETDTLTDPQARRVVDRILPEASRKNTIWLRRRLRKACLQLDPDTAKERAAKAVTERSVTIRPLRDGLMSLQAIGPADAVLAMFRILDETADRGSKDDPRTTTARRFDALTHAVLHTLHNHHPHPDNNPGSGANSSPGSAPNSGPNRGWDHIWDYVCDSGYNRGRPTDPPGCTPDCPPQPKIPALVQITMDLPTLLGLANNPAELHGYGPLPANLARKLAADADWQRFIQDPITGEPQDLGRTRRHPDAALRRWIIARDKTCLFPECYRPAKDCEPDHNPAWQHGGGTDKDTLSQLCPKHHKVHHHGWAYQRHPDRITWTSPHGQIYERYFNEADLIGPDEACPHLDTDFADTIWPATDDDQRLEIFLPKPRPGQRRDPDEEIPWHIVQAFRLEEIDTWPVDADGKLLDELVLTPEQQQELLDAHHFRLYGSTEPPPPENPTYRPHTNRARTKPGWDTLPDEPPF